MDNPLAPKIEQINHSGNLPESMVEKPVHESDVPLAEASLQQFASLDQNAEHPAEIDYLAGNTVLTEEASTEKSQIAPEAGKSKYSLRIKLGALAGGLALAAGGFFAVKAVADTPQTQPQDKDDKATSEVTSTPTSTSVESDTPTPSETQSPGTQPEGEATVASIEIPAGLSPEAYGKALFDKGITQWTMAGATQENEIAFVKSGDNSNEFLNTLAAANAKIFAEALFTPDWQSDPASHPDITKFIEGMTANNKAALEMYFKTDLLGQDAYEYKASANSTTVETQSSGDKSYTTKETEYNNASDNKAGELLPELLDQNNSTYTFTYSTKVIDGKEKISNLSAN